VSATTLVEAIEPALERGDCEHTAVLLRSLEALPPVLASFFSIGASRNGWLVHGSLPGQADADRRQITAAGLDVTGLEAAGRLAVVELDLSVSPDEWVKPWSSLLETKLESGFGAMWFTRFPIGPTDDEVAGVLPFEEAWMSCFRGRPVVTLCPYIVGGLEEDRRARHRHDVSRVHDQIFEATG
jgi:hypothetical protein